MDQRPPDREVQTEGSEPRPGEGAEDALRRLEERLGRASEAAERMLADAAGTVGRAARSGGPPPAGWQQPGAEEDRRRSGDLELLSQVLSSLRDLIPPDLQRRLADALRELLSALRALIDWYLERVQRRRSEAGEVQDIPIS